MHRELGLIAFGNPQAYDVPEFVGDALYSIFETIQGNAGIPSSEWDTCYGVDFPNTSELTVRSYDWMWDGDDEDMLPNVEFRDVRVWWYKYLGRSMTADKKLTTRQWQQWLAALAEHADSVTPDSVVRDSQTSP